MKLLIIYGPPAAGKLTVAREVEKLTGYKVFHNHLSIDCVRPVFEFGTPPFGRLIEKIRMETITEAARENVDLIHTFAYAKGHDDECIGRLLAAVEENGAEVCLVLLKCDRDENRKRVTAESRSRMGKIATAEMLDSIHERYDLISAIPGRETLVIDNTELPAVHAAQQIIDHFELNH